MRYLTFTDELCLVEQVLSKTKAQADVKANVNHLLIYDRSYSMSYELKPLGKDLIEKIKELPVGDTVTLGWFSGEGSFNFILKGFRITDERDFGLLEKTVNANLTPIGCTCFSEILEDTDQVIKDLSPLSDLFSFTFFTDGHPVVSSYQREISNIKKAIAKIEGRIASGLFVGYGNYYNKKLMTEMAADLGGSLVHCSSLADYKTSLGVFMAEASDNGTKAKASLVTDTRKEDLVFAINGQSIAAFAVAEDNTVSFTPKKTGDSQIYIVTKQPPLGAKKVKLTQNAFSTRDPLVKGAYAASYLLTQAARSDVALEILGALGDVALIDQVNNSFTLDEFGRTETLIKKAVTHPTYGRFTKGRDTQYLPPRDAFCVLDAIEILLADNGSCFFPYHEDFNYRRIGVPAKVKEGYPEFTPDYTTACPFSSLTWHKERLNLSVLAKIPGTVEFTSGYGAEGFQKNFPTYIYRNYAIVKDGFLNVGRIPVKLDTKTRKDFNARGLIETKDKTDILCLEKLPVINRSIADGKTSAKDLCRQVYEEVLLQSDLKAFKFLRNEIEPVVEATRNDYFSDSQIKYLADNGIGKNGFAPETEGKEDAKDFYYAKEFQIKIKGLSALPSIKAVREKVEAGKNLNVSASLIKNSLDKFNFVSDKTTRAKLGALDDYIKDKKFKLLDNRQQIQRTKFSMLLASKWFDEFDSREDCTLEVDGNHFTIGVREVKLDI